MDSFTNNADATAKPNNFISEEIAEIPLSSRSRTTLLIDMMRHVRDQIDGQIRRLRGLPSRVAPDFDIIRRTRSLTNRLFSDMATMPVIEEEMVEDEEDEQEELPPALDLNFESEIADEDRENNRSSLAPLFEPPRHRPTPEDLEEFGLVVPMAFNPQDPGDRGNNNEVPQHLRVRYPPDYDWGEQVMFTPFDYESSDDDGIVPGMLKMAHNTNKLLAHTWVLRLCAFFLFSVIYTGFINDTWFSHTSGETLFSIYYMRVDFLRFVTPFIGVVLGQCCREHRALKIWYKKINRALFDTPYFSSAIALFVLYDTNWLYPSAWVPGFLAVYNIAYYRDGGLVKTDILVPLAIAWWISCSEYGFGTWQLTFIITRVNYLMCEMVPRSWYWTKTPRYTIPILLEEYLRCLFPHAWIPAVEFMQTGYMGPPIIVGCWIGYLYTPWIGILSGFAHVLNNQVALDHQIIPGMPGRDATYCAMMKFVKDANSLSKRCIEAAFTHYFHSMGVDHRKIHIVVSHIVTIFLSSSITQLLAAIHAMVVSLDVLTFDMLRKVMQMFRGSIPEVQQNGFGTIASLLERFRNNDFARALLSIVTGAIVIPIVSLTGTKWTPKMLRYIDTKVLHSYQNDEISFFENMCKSADKVIHTLSTAFETGDYGSILWTPHETHLVKAYDVAKDFELGISQYSYHEVMAILESAVASGVKLKEEAAKRRSVFQYKRELDQLKDWRARFASKIKTEQRRTPLGIYLFGNAGVGKTHTSRFIITMLSNYMIDRKLRKEPIEYKDVANQNLESSWWENIKTSSVGVVGDEYGTAKIEPKDSILVSNLLTLVSNSPMEIPRAFDKATHYACPEFVMLMGNTLGANIRKTFLASGAFYRRFKCIEVVRNGIPDGNLTYEDCVRTTRYRIHTVILDAQRNAQWKNEMDPRSEYEEFSFAEFQRKLFDLFDDHFSVTKEGNDLNAKAQKAANDFMQTAMVVQQSTRPSGYEKYVETYSFFCGPYLHRMNSLWDRFVYWINYRVTGDLFFCPAYYWIISMFWTFIWVLTLERHLGSTVVFVTASKTLPFYVVMPCIFAFSRYAWILARVARRKSRRYHLIYVSHYRDLTKDEYSELVVSESNHLLFRALSMTATLLFVYQCYRSFTGRWREQFKYDPDSAITRGEWDKTLQKYHISSTVPEPDGTVSAMSKWDTSAGMLKLHKLPSDIDQFQAVLAKSLVKVRCGDRTVKGWICGINTVVFPKHVINGANLRIEYFTRNRNPSVVLCDASTAIIKGEFALVVATVPKLVNFRDRVLLEPPGSSYKNMQVKGYLMDGKNTTPIVMFYDGEQWVYQWPGNYEGSCGTLVVIQQPRLGIVGMHRLAGANDVCKADLMLSSDLESPKSLFTEQYACLEDSWDVRPGVSEKSYFNWVQPNNVSVEGTVLGVSIAPSRSMAKISPLAKYIERFGLQGLKDGETLFTPPRMRASKNWQPLAGTFDKMDSAKIDRFDIVSRYAESFVDGLMSTQPKADRPYDLDVAIVGRARLGSINKLNPRSACGLDIPGKKKRDFIEDCFLDFHPDGKTLDDTSKAYVLDVIKMIQGGYFPQFLYKLNLKDEARKRGKHPRVFYGPQFVHVVLSRMFVLPLIQSLMKNKRFGCRVGINATSRDWEDMVTEMFQTIGVEKNYDSPQFGETDVSGFDTRMWLSVKWVFIHYMLQLARESDYSDAELKVVWVCLTNDYVITVAVKDVMVRCATALGSGVVGTAERNSFLLTFLIYVAYKMHDKDGDFWTTVAPSVYGDDNLYATNDPTFTPWVIQQNLSQLDVKITSATKAERCSDFLIPITESTFLNRGFVVRDGIMFAPLAESSFVKMLQVWLPSDEGYQLQVTSTLISFLYESIQHGREIFEERKKIVFEILPELFEEVDLTQYKPLCLQYDDIVQKSYSPPTCHI